MVGKLLGEALTGKGAHAETGRIFDGLDWNWTNVRPERAPHSIYELLRHMSYWQDWVLKWLDGKQPPIPKHAAGSWPKTAGAASPEDWKIAVNNYCSGLRRLESWSQKADLLAKRGSKTPLEMLQKIALHNSYHAGQVVALRQTLGWWPPPSGGLTW